MSLNLLKNHFRGDPAHHFTVASDKARKKDWSPIAAVVLWCAAGIGVAYDVNLIAGPAIHHAINYTANGSFKAIAGYQAEKPFNLLGSLQNNFVVADDNLHQFSNYTANRGGLDKEIQSARDKRDMASQRLVGFAAMTEMAKQIKDPFVKAAAITGWVNTVIEYDYDKLALDEAGKTDYDHWYNPPQTTLIAEKGVCIDKALLTYEALIRTGFAPEDIKIIILEIDESKKIDDHAVVGLTINGMQYIVENAVYSLPKQMTSYHYFDYTVAIWQADVYFNRPNQDHYFGNATKVIPISAEGLDTNVVFKSAAPSEKIDHDNLHPIDPVAQLYAAMTPENEIWHDLDIYNRISHSAIDLRNRFINELQPRTVHEVKVPLESAAAPTSRPLQHTHHKSPVHIHHRKPSPSS